MIPLLLINKIAIRVARFLRVMRVRNGLREKIWPFCDFSTYLAIFPPLNVIYYFSCISNTFLQLPSVVNSIVCKMVLVVCV